MNTKLIKTMLLLLSISSVSITYAQFGKLLNKVAEKALGSPENDAKKAITPDKKDLKALEEDAADSFLENQVFKKEGPSGIYYASVPLGIKNIVDDKILAVKKIYLEFDDSNFKANMYTRYHFQKKNGNPIIDAQYTSWISSGISGKAKAMLLQQMRSKGIIHYRECYMPDIAYVQYRTKNPADGVKKGEVKGLLQLEPGLFYVSDEPYAASEGNPYGHNLFEGQQYLFFYKAGLEDKIKNYPPAKIAQIFQEIEKKKEEAYTAGNSLPKKMTPAQAPSQKSIMDAIKKRVEDYNWKETPIYGYPISEWIPQYKNLHNGNGEYLKTLTSRIMSIVALFKKPDGTCGFMNMQIEQQNSYSKAGDLKENFVAPPIDYANSGIDPIPCEKIMMYKPKN
ncbi:hypothetical protein V3470_12455 [Flavobacterium oreochromis]|uniref:Uncharacterized protein n=1 Tax=Flavobacterium oreochromis TaxID=2906078 RepID=A0ABW8PB63_9FLAO|nr:hypothetical protein [Flavobacterium oreochromis]OWP77490.1 hypothetical protein BWG23_04970 [Flavobacterium oreochromis]